MRRTVASTSALIMASLILVACGGTDAADDQGSPDAATQPAEPNETDESTGDSEWEVVLEAARQEGAVTVYSSRPLVQLENVVSAFEDRYPEIRVDVIRLTDGDLGARVEAEHAAGRVEVDFWETSSIALVEPKAEEGGWFAEPIGPSFSADGYEASYIHEGSFFETGGAVLGIGWNTDLYPGGLEDYPDLLDEDLAGGRIAVLDVTVAPVAVDFYHYLEERFGEEFLEQLAAQDPQIYGSAVPIGEALAAGEIAASSFNQPLLEQMAAGAPVDFAVPEPAWGTKFFGAVDAEAPNPNAAQVFADYLISREGQEVAADGLAAVLPDIPGALTTNDLMREQQLDVLTDQVVSDYNEKWAALFQ